MDHRFAEQVRGDLRVQRLTTARAEDEVVDGVAIAALEPFGELGRPVRA